VKRDTISLAFARSALADAQSQYKALARIEGELTRDERAEKARASRLVERWRHRIDNLQGGRK
jgi:hypothetical protein